MGKNTMQDALRHRTAWVMLGIALLATGCAGGGGRRSGGSAGSVAATDIRGSEEVFPGADRDQLWEAAKGYMEVAFPVAEVVPGFAESEMLEWVQDGFPHRTRVSVEVEGPAGLGRQVLRVVALAIEPDLNAIGTAPDGKPIEYDWMLRGHHPEIEAVVMEQIRNRYFLVREGRDPSTAPPPSQLPGIGPSRPGGYLRPGDSSGR